MRTLLSVLSVASLLWVVVMAGCNTTRGFGDDIDALGENISEAADNTGGTKDY